MTKGDWHSREAWLYQATYGHLKPLFKQLANVDIPDVRVSVGFALGSKTLIGQCWTRDSASDGLNQIFVSPRLGDVMALATLVHELVHAVQDCQTGHGPEYARLAKAVGLEPGPRGFRSTLPGPELVLAIQSILSDMPKYPHAQIKPPEAAEKKQATRMLKVTCTDRECGYVVRTTQKWVDVGLPTCHCGSDMALA
jgi:hypothetical protein